MEFDPAGFHVNPPHQERLIDLLRELEFTTLLKSFQAASKPDEPNPPRRKPFRTNHPRNDLWRDCPKSGYLGRVLPAVRWIQRQAESKASPSRLTEKRPSFRSMSGHLCGPSRRCCRITIDQGGTRSEGDPPRIPSHRCHVAGPYFDTMITDYLLNPNRRDHGLDTIAMEVLGHRLGEAHHETARRNRFLKKTRARVKKPRRPPPRWPRLLRS